MNQFKIKFWGVRGTVPVPGNETLEYGGNTSCVEMSCNGKRLIFDAGTGLRVLAASATENEFDILLSHTHLDHIQGIPFFMPLYKKGVKIRFWAGHLTSKNNLKEVISHLMYPPIFPLTLKDVASDIEFKDFKAGDEITDFSSYGIDIETKLLNHPDRAIAYRVNCNGKSVCYVTDVEHKKGEVDKELVEFIRGADIFIYDSSYDDEIFDKFIGWGHSTWQQAVRLADEAGVKKLFAFHHDSGLTDKDLKKREKNIKKMAKCKAVLAKDGMEVVV